jgi:hypothetical protein
MRDVRCVIVLRCTKLKFKIRQPEAPARKGLFPRWRFGLVVHRMNRQAAFFIPIPASSSG